MLEYGKLTVELIGTFVFLSVILQTLKDPKIGPHAVAVTLLAVIYFGASTSGAHFNPAVTFAMYMEDSITIDVAIAYVGVQLFATFLAIKFYNLVLKDKNF